jgi:hypothetical protein
MNYVSAFVGVLAAAAVYWVMTSYRWHSLVHRNRDGFLFNNRAVCRHCHCRLGVAYDRAEDRSDMIQDLTDVVADVIALKEGIE